MKDDKNLSKPDNNITINKPAQMSKATETFNKIVSDIKSLITGDIKNLTRTLADGRELYVESTADAPAVGDSVTVDGKVPEDGALTLSDGTVLTITAGVISVITPAVL